MTHAVRARKYQIHEITHSIFDYLWTEEIRKGTGPDILISLEGDQRQHVGGEEVVCKCRGVAHNITSGVVLTDGILSPDVVALDVCASQLRRGLPNKLGEVSS